LCYTRDMNSLFVPPAARFWFVLVLCLWAACPIARGTETDLDFADQLPRVPPRSPQDALRAFHILDGFRIELAAAEPLIADPVALSFDEDGRMYVVEMRGYSEDADACLGQIRLVTDTDDDGRYDQSTVFASGLSWPTAVVCFDGGIYVAAAPELMFLRDNDGDGLADERRVVTRGFGRSNVQGLVNSFAWGLDNRIHGATSSTGARLENLVNLQQQPIELRGRDFCFDPRTHQFTPTTGGGQHGLSFNRWGEKFVCSNSDHIQQVVGEDHYLARNPLMVPLPMRVSIATDGPQAPVFRTSPVESWRVIRTRLRVSGAVPGPIEGGGTAAGYFTGATGITLYRGNAWPKAHLDTALICDVGSNLIHRKRLLDQGTRYRAERIDAQCEILTSDDIWFRPVQLANGPDGALYVLDMYREVIEHPDSLPPVIKRHLDLTSGRNLGRIYRMVPTDFVRPAPRKLSQCSTAELVALLEHPNGWHRETAARLLYERCDPAAESPLRRLLHESKLAEGRVHAMYALGSLGELASDDLRHALSDPEPHVRRHAVRLAESAARDDRQLAKDLFQRVDDPAIKVRYQLAFSLGALPDSSRRQQALARLARQAVDDEYVLAAVQTSLLDGATQTLDRLARDEAFRQHDQGRRFLRQLAAQVRRQASESEVPALSQLLADLSRDQAVIVPDLLLELTVPRDNPLAGQLRRGTTGTILDDVIERARNTAVDTAQPVDHRASAIDQFVLAEWEQVAELYDQLLDASQPLPVQLRAVDSLEQQPSPAVAQDLLSNWDRYSPSLRQPLISRLMSRTAWQAQLLEAIDARQLNLQDLNPAQQQQLARVAGRQRWDALERRFNLSLDPNIESILERYRQALQGPADMEAGRAVFRMACASCHRLEGFGYELGPNLAAMQNRGAEVILINVLDPNREVNPQFLAYAASTHDGRVFAGMIRNETATSIELVQADNKSDTLLRDEIESLSSTHQSLMPTGMERQVSPAAMNDLIGYLRSVSAL
jgi:putative membrane-bound dehydrogenase-like protein